MIEFCGTQLEHPVINASGTFDVIAARRVFGDAVDENLPFSAFVTKTVTNEPRQGNPPPRLWETSAGLINSIGLPNKGRERFITEDLPELKQLPVPLIVNVMGSTAEEVGELVEAFSEHDEIAALELNVSCPNVKTGLLIGADANELTGFLRQIRPLTKKPLIVKLTPNATDVPAIARAAEATGANAVSLINTLRGMALRPGTSKPWLGGITGGVSGPTIRAIALTQVAEVAAAISIPIVGMGGIQTASHARDFIAVGATLVAVGTQTFLDPTVAKRIADAI